MSFLKEHWFKIFIVIAVVIALFLFTCNGGIGTKPKSDTVVYVKQEPQPPVQVPVYIPVASGTSAPIVIPPSYQPNTENLEALLKQYNELITKFLTVRTYTDSVQLKDSTGKRVGVFHNNDIVTENEIKKRAPWYQLDFPHTYTVITNTNPPKRVLFLGGGIISKTRNPFSGGTLGAIYKDKKDNLFQFQTGAILTPGVPAQPYIGLSIYKPVHLNIKLPDLNPFNNK